MANTAQAKKRAKQAEKRRAHNASRKSEMRTYLKNVVKAVAAGNVQLAEQIYHKAQSTVDKLAVKNYIHKNKAARHKARLNAAIKKLKLSQAAS